MNQAKKHESIEGLELKISLMLRYGALAAGVLLLLGWIWIWTTHGDTLHAHSVYNPTPITTALETAWQNKDGGTLVAFFGLGFLVSLPMIRVFLTAILFYREKDHILAFMALLVFLALCFGFVLGFEV